MNRHDLDLYYIPAVKKICDGTDYVTYTEAYKFDRLLGLDLIDPFTSRSTAQDFPMSDSLRDLLIKLAGPHGKAVLKAYRINKGLRDEPA